MTPYDWILTAKLIISVVAVTLIFGGYAWWFAGKEGDE